MLRVTLLYDLFCGLKIVGVDLNLAANRFNPQPRDRDLFVKNNNFTFALPTTMLVKIK